MNTEPDLEMWLMTRLQAVRETGDEAARRELNDLLREDSRARAALARLMVDEHAIISRLRDASITAVLDAEPSIRRAPARRRWISWSPFATAAAGLMIGLLSASVVFAYVVPRAAVSTRVAVSIADASFEKAAGVVEKGFPTEPLRWSADAARAVRGENGIGPKQGQAMLRLEPLAERPYSRLVQVVDVTRLPVAAGGMREMEVSAWFHSAGTEATRRYKVRVFGFAETAGALQPFPLETEDEGIVSATRLLDVAPGESDWQPVTTKLALPPAVRSVVIWIGACVREPGAAKSVHYVDDVRATLLVSPAENAGAAR